MPCQLAEVMFTFVFVAICGWATEDTKKNTIGPWEIEATFENDKFDHCAICRTVDEALVKFIRTNDGLSLVLQSPNWKLERGKSYPVHMKAGALAWDTEVAAEPNSVSVPVADTRFKNGIRVANVLLGATIRIPLNQSVEALNRLDECFAKNSRAVETNPFVAPKGQP